MVSPVFVASLVTVVPAMAAVWYFLRRYEGYFDDARVFFALIVGFFLGLATAAIELLVFQFGSGSFRTMAGIGAAFLFFVVGYSFFETGVKTVVLGLRRFKGRRDTPYYGAALGLGMGAMMAMLLTANALRIGEELGVPYQPLSFALMVLIPLGSVFAHGAVGAWVGKGAADDKLWKGWGIGTLLMLPMLGIYWLWWPSLGLGNVVLVVPPVMSIVYGVALLWITRVRILDTVVPKEIQDQIRREKRREARQGGQGGQAVAAAAPVPRQDASDDSEE